MNIYILSEVRNFQDALASGELQQYLTLNGALADAREGQYVHSIYADTYPVIIGINSLGPLV